MRTNLLLRMLSAFLRFCVSYFQIYRIVFSFFFLLTIQTSFSQYVVRSNADNITGAGDPLLGQCGNYNTLPLAQRTLRLAVMCAAPNSTITFDLPVGQETFLITPQALPVNYWQGAFGIDKRLTITGPNANGNEIILNGQGNSNAFSIGWWSAAPAPGASGTVIEGLTIINTQSAISIGPVMSDNIIIRDNHIGITQTGLTGAGYYNEEHGIIVIADDPTNGNFTGGGQYVPFIGTSNITIEDNVISGNLKNGVQLNYVDGGVINENLVGTDLTGQSCIGNGFDGINLTNSGGFDVYDNVMSCNGGGEVATSFNGKRGLYLQESSNNTIRSNKIGTDIDGIDALPNHKSGLLIAQGSNNNIIGGITADSLNIISGNGVETTILAMDGVTVLDYSAILDKHGIVIDDGDANTPSEDNHMRGNYIGVNINGVALGNSKNGIEIIGAGEDNVIGGPTAAYKNVISSNGANGISIAIGSRNNVIQNNFIGSDINGYNVIPDMGNGNMGIIFNSGTTGDLVAPQPLEGNQIIDNVISNNLAGGIQTYGEEEIDGIVIQGNIIGLDKDGVDAGMGNIGDGILIQTDLTDIFIGGSVLGEGNIIGRNTGNGINIEAANATGGNNVILGNYIGTEIDGVTRAQNGLNGIKLGDQTSGIIIGGINANERNVLSGNVQSGIYIDSDDVDNIDILGNNIGLDLNNNALGNTSYGVQIAQGGTNISIGGVADSSKNVISNNGIDGVFIQGGTNVNVLKNYIGTNHLGTAAMPNLGHGVNVSGGVNVVVGNSGNANVISSNTLNGVNVSGGTTVTVAANTIGLALNGTTPLPNGEDGVNVSGGTGVAIGTAGVGNIIGANLGSGIEFNGSNSAATVESNTIGVVVANAQNGITLNNSDSVTIGGLTAASRNIISGNTGDGINVNNSDDNTIQNNYIGVNAAGTAALANTGDGIEVSGGSSGNSIDTDNVISGNVAQGINIHGAGTNDNEVKGNIIGLNALGAAAIPNTINGVFIHTGASGTIIGGGLVADRNVISGNNVNGIAGNGSSDNVIAGNYIGTDATGAIDLGNVAAGISFEGVTNNIIGGVGLDSVNVISGNGTHGLYLVIGSTGNNIRGNIIGLNALGDDSLGNAEHGVFLSASSNQTFVGNTISGNGSGKSLTQVPNGHGIVSTSSTDLTFYGNNIGTDVTGTDALGNAQDGLNLTNADGTIIGGTGAGERNVISGNGGFDPTNNTQFCTGGQKVGDGIRLGNSANVTVAGNYIGIGSDDQPLGNQENGIDLTAVTSSTIGGSTALEGNVISSNVYKGIVMSSSNDNAISANLIGTNATGLLDYGNGSGETGPVSWLVPTCTIGDIGGSGIIMMGSSNNVIGGAGDLRNVLSGNTESGIWLQLGANDNEIYNNYIGTDINGTSAIPNDQSGIFIQLGNTGNIIGATGLGNVISGNRMDGVEVLGNINNTATIAYNTIGLGSDGSILSNDSSGVSITDNATLVTTSNNTISGNVKHGVEIISSPSQAITNNRIGTDALGTSPIGNTESGVYVSGSTSTSITGNTIGGNTDGVELDGGATSTIITGNFIGTDAAGTANVANTNAGVLVTNGTNSNISTNTIAYSAGDGVIVTAGTGNAIIQNSMFCNDQTTAAAGGAPTAVGTGITLSATGNNGFLNAQTFSTKRPLIKTTTNEMIIPFGPGSSVSTIGSLNGSTVHIYSYDDNCENCQPRVYTGESVTLGASNFGTGVEDTTITIPITAAINPNTTTYVVIITDAAGNSSQVSGCSEVGCTPPTAAFTTFPGTGDLVGDSLLVLCDGALAEDVVATDDALFTEYIEWFTIDNTGDTTTSEEGLGDFTYSAAIPAVGDTTGYVFLTYPDAFKECFNVSDTLYITSIGNLAIDIDADQVLCEDSVYTLVSDTVINGSTFDWSVTTGAVIGTLASTTDALHPTYTAGDNDATTVTIELSATGLTPSRGAVCGQIDSTMDITVHQKPEVEAGDDGVINICPGSTLDLTGLTTPSSATNALSIAWTDSIGTDEANGNFTAPTNIATSYDVAVADSGATIKLVVVATGEAECPVATDFINITVLDSTRFVMPISDTTICEGATIDLASIGGGAYNTQNDDTYLWSVVPGEGVLSAIAVPRPTYQAASPASTSVTLTAEVEGVTAPSHGGGVCHQAQDVLTININPFPTVEAGTLSPTTQCSGVNVALGTGAGSTDTDSLYWTHNGSGTWQGGDSSLLASVYIPDSTDAGTTVDFTIHGISSCGTPTDIVSVNLLASPVVRAGNDTTICEGTVLDLSGLTMLPDTSGGATSILWSGGAGTIGTTTTLLPTYTPDASEYGTTVTLTLTASNGLGGVCGSVSDSMDITINRQATVVDASDVAICEGDTLDLASLPTTLPDTMYTAGILWTGGTGQYLTSDTLLRPKYVPNALEFGTSVALTLNVTALPECVNVTDVVNVSIGQQPTVTKPADQVICENGIVNLSSTITNEGTIIWSSSTGRGNFGTVNAANSTYTADALDYNDTITIYVDVSSVTPECSAVRDSMLLGISPQAVVGIDPTAQICSGSGYALVGTGNASAVDYGTLTWTSSTGRGVFSPDANTLNATFTPDSLDDGSTVDVTLSVTSITPCVNVDTTIAIEIEVSPSVTLTPTAMCENDTLDLSTVYSNFKNTTGSSTYRWLPLAADITPDNTTLAAEYIPGIGTGGTDQTISLEITELSAPTACQTQVFPVVITIEEAPVVDLIGPYEFCIGVTKSIPSAEIQTTPAGIGLTWTAKGYSGTYLGGNSYTGVAEDVGEEIWLIATTAANGSCAGVSDSAQIDVQSIPVPTIGIPNTVCTNAVSGYEVLSSDSASEYIWSVSQGLGFTALDKLSSGATDDSISVNFSSAVDTVVLSVTETDEFECVGTSSIDIKILEEFTPRFSIDEPSGCTGEDVTFTIKDVVPANNSINNNYTWYLNDTLLFTSNATTFTIDSLIPLDKIKVEFSSGLSCISSSTQSTDTIITLNPDINYQPEVPNLSGTDICFPFNLDVKDDNNVDAEVQEWFINGSSTAAASGVSVYNESLPIGSYQFMYKVSNGNGACEASDVIALLVDGVEIEARVAKDEIEEGESTDVSMRFLSGNVPDVYVWENITHQEDLPGITEFKDNAPLSVTPEESTVTYQVIATTLTGCIDTAEVSVDVFLFCVPENVFTPNGDGDNDTWVADCLNDGSFPQAVLTVYNRWGDIVYRDGNGYIEPWDGTRNGEPMPMATYWWVLEFNKLGKVAHGDVTILR